MDELLTLNDSSAMEVKKYRVEIICSQALEEDFAEEFKINNVAKMFTRVDDVKGAGYSNPHLGDAVWPQLNTMYIIYCNKEDADKIAAIVLKLRKLYRTEGIGCFVSQSNELYSM